MKKKIALYFTNRAPHYQTNIRKIYAKVSIPTAHTLLANVNMSCEGTQFYPLFNIDDEKKDICEKITVS